jgi:hypothetical protein
VNCNRILHLPLLLRTVIKIQANICDFAAYSKSLSTKAFGKKDGFRHLLNFVGALIK